MGFFSSSSSSKGDTNAAANQAPTRSSRRQCWESRDAYYACLSSHRIVVPPGTDMSDGRGMLGEAAAEEQRTKRDRLEDEVKNDPCASARGPYEENCAKSWIDYFNKRRVLEERQKLLYSQGAQPTTSSLPPSRGSSSGK
ncbi:hypothetical protein FA10DRAFT_232651 [Acaromyces ingoldii]|uniref:Cytochrome c oxidase, subunit VIb n=1 Tax=Acaromyces ingoldii TaxID=215250 RepID=A0A316YGS6_9BASI|nr:hypothetical protein FA10DRAFT_232651 [Acaromyces ingoldii]PWN88627.1 hypothetical protein FA10DRAFT_232651 [Acaromyces ingoldii]